MFAMKLNEKLFLRTYVLATAMTTLVVISLLVLDWLTANLPTAFDTIIIFFLQLLLNVILFLKLIKPDLLKIEYNGENSHLFSKHIAMQELLLTTAIAFFVGIIPAYAEYQNISSGSYAKFIANISSIWFCCIFSSYNCLLNHTRNVWVADHSKRIFDQSKEETKE